MIKNYLKEALRNLWKNKTYSIINILGLTAGTVCCLYILLYIREQNSFDDHHKDADKIFRITTDIIVNGKTEKFATTSPVMAATIAAIIAIPIAGWMMEGWLNDFAYRTAIYWWVFVIAGFITLCIAVFTVGLKALTAASANPVKSLRTE